MEQKKMEKKIIILEETVKSLEERLEQLDLCFELLLDTLESRAHKKQPRQNVSSYFSVN